MSDFDVPTFAARTAAAGLALLLPQALRAQGTPAGPIVVTASLSGQGIGRDLVGSSITLLDAQDIADRETRIVSDVLRDVPGVAVSRTGAVGGLTSIRIRGSESNQVLVFVDGIKVSDPYQGEYDFATLVADDAARIEVLRGQQSALYGSDAIGGVINYTTLSGREAPGLRLRAEGGSFGTANGTARFAGASEAFDYVLSAAYNHTDGYPTAPGGSRNVGSDIASLSTKLAWTPSQTFKLSAVLRYGHAQADTNDQDASTTAPSVNGRQVITVIDTPGSFYRNKALFGLLRADLTSLDGRMTTSLSAQFADTRRDAYAVYGYSYGDHGTRYRGSLVNMLDLGTDRVRHRIALAVDLERESYRNADPLAPDPSRKTIDTVGLVGQYILTLDDRFALGGSLRHDGNSLFDDATTWHVETSYVFASGTRIHAAAGSGVKAPVSFELFGYFDGQYIGNPDLHPEKSTGWEAGIDQRLADGALTIGATFFKSRLTGEIYTDYLPPDYVATSLNRTTATHQQGVELFGDARLGAFRASASWTWLDAPQSRNVLLEPQDPDSFSTGPVVTQAAQRPSHMGSLNLTYAPASLPVSGTLTIRHSGKTKDVAFTPDYSSLFVDLPAYTLVNLSLRYHLSAQLDVYARAENLFDADYQQVFTYETPGRAVYAGVRARF